MDPLTLLGFGKDVIASIYALVKTKVVVKPKSFSTFPNNWNTIREVVVSNMTEDPLFGIQIVLWSNGVHPKMEITIEDQNEGHTESMGNVDINTDSFIVNGIANKKDFMLIQLNYLQSKTSRRIFIKPIGASNVKLGVVKFSKDPVPMATKENGVAIQFKNPFDMEIKSLSVLMKRK